ncbi:MAG: hypothetical protein J5I90_15360 [Caldilineales bacterium]|nr:hypothetical protein [Caldilineales bacterium]
MSEPSPVIRASEVGQWAYCHRAWWLAQQGFDNQNVAVMAAGTEAHEQHNRAVASAQRTRNLAVILLACGAVLLLAALLIGLF